MIKIKSSSSTQILCKLLPAAIFVTLLMSVLPYRATAAEESGSYGVEGDIEKSRQETIPIDVESQLDAHIKSYIDSYEATYCTAAVTDSDCRGNEYKDTRRFCLGDIDGDGRDDIAVLYTIEGFCCGNNYSFYLAVFLNKGHKYEFATSEKIGGGGERIVALNAIRDGRIILDTKEYLPDDPMCCPSGKGKTTYSLKNRKLVESDRIGEKPMSPIERFQRQLDRSQPLVDELLNEKERQKRTDAPQSK